MDAAYRASHETYGAPRTLHDLRAKGIRVGKKRIRTSYATRRDPRRFSSAQVEYYQA
ncbi:MAG: IS3 family transposase [Thermoleophilia bacterium]